MYNIVSKYYNTIMCYICIYVFTAMSAYSKTLSLLLHINTLYINMHRHLELENYAHVMTMGQTDSYMKKYSVGSTLFIFSCRSKT